MLYGFKPEQPWRSVFAINDSARTRYVCPNMHHCLVSGRGAGRLGQGWSGGQILFSPFCVVCTSNLSWAVSFGKGRLNIAESGVILVKFGLVCQLRESMIW